MPYGKSLGSTYINISMTKSEWDMLINAVFEYGYVVSENSIYDVELLERVRHKFETRMARQLEKPRLKYRK